MTMAVLSFSPVLGAKNYAPKLTYTPRSPGLAQLCAGNYDSNHYQRRDLSHDIMAGLIVGMVTIPQAVAYALLAGVLPQSGLYACLLPMVLYAVFGSSKQLVVGPVAVAALLVTATVSELAPRYGEAYWASLLYCAYRLG